MKKFLLPIAILAMVSVSCSKECECVTTVAGITSTTTVEIESGKCSDMNVEGDVMGIKTVTECK